MTWISYNKTDKRNIKVTNIMDYYKPQMYIMQPNIKHMDKEKLPHTRRTMTYVIKHF